MSVFIKLSCFNLELAESVDVVKKYQFIETRKGWINGFTELRKFGKFRYFIRHTVSDKWHVTNFEDSEAAVKYFLRLSGY